MSPPADKIRPWVEIGCRFPDCEFRTVAEWAAMRHEAETGHRMEWWGTSEGSVLEPGQNAGREARADRERIMQERDGLRDRLARAEEALEAAREFAFDAWSGYEDEKPWCLTLADSYFSAFEHDKEIPS